MKITALSTGSQLWRMAGLLASVCAALNKSFTLRIPLLLTWRMWVVNSILSLNVACLDNKYFWLSIFPCIKE